MGITLRKIDSTTEISSEQLRERALTSSKSVHTTHYIALDQSTEIAFVSVDRVAPKKTLCIYELFVDPTKRNHGYGTRAIEILVLMAKREKFKSICLIPFPIEPGNSEQTLKDWYKRLGFSQSYKQHNLLEIVF